MDDCLYHLCRENPKHDSLLAINAKIFIIGLTFETGVKRQVRSKRTQGSSLTQVVNLIHTNHQSVDQQFHRLSAISEPLTASKLADILDIHGILVKLRELSVRVRRSEAVALRQPVVPVADGLDGRFIRVDSSELGEWHGHIAAVPANQHQHIVGTGIFRR